jgi:hypothetical protein
LEIKEFLDFLSFLSTKKRCICNYPNKKEKKERRDGE